MLRVFYNGFWEEPSETELSPLFVFFQDLLERTFHQRATVPSSLQQLNPEQTSFAEDFGTKIVLTKNIEDGDILMESVFLNHTGSKFTYKKWKYTLFFSMENRIVQNYPEYDCVLWGEDLGGNVVCCPAFVPHLFINNGLVELMNNATATATTMVKIPPKNRICVIISNPGGQDRNTFLDTLERYFQVDYAGRYRNNVPAIQAPFSSPEFLQFVGQYRCVLTMENSRGGAYITEKITHGLLAGTIPIYWGARDVAKYLNEDRFIHVRDMNPEEMKRACQQIHTVMNDDEVYRTMASQPIFRDASGNAVSKMTIDMDSLVQEMQRVLHLT
jgi:hypothetical protein